jgi:hypothetical protein
VRDPPPLKLSRLRDIGWANWDPIGLLAKGEPWDHQPFADEYNRYLLRVASGLRRSWSATEAVEYLVEIESEHMGLGVRPSTRARAQATVREIHEYIKSIAS